MKNIITLIFVVFMTACGAAEESKTTSVDPTGSWDNWCAPYVDGTNIRHVLKVEDSSIKEWAIYYDAADIKCVGIANGMTSMEGTYILDGDTMTITVIKTGVEAITGKTMIDASKRYSLPTTLKVGFNGDNLETTDVNGQNKISYYRNK